MGNLGVELVLHDVYKTIWYVTAEETVQMDLMNRTAPIVHVHHGNGSVTINAVCMHHGGVMATMIVQTILMRKTAVCIEAMSLVVMR